MVPLISERSDALADLCRRSGVRRLYLFGSALPDRFNPGNSDLDFVVDMANRQPTGAYADRYFGLIDGLEKLFDRRVELVTEQCIRNPYFREEVENTRQLVYEQPNSETAV